MLFVDFEYDSRLLSDFGLMVCIIDQSGGVTTVDAGSQLTFNTLNLKELKKFKKTTTQYNTAYTATFQVAKVGCNVAIGDNYIHDYELSQIMRWLNKQNYIRFKPIFDNGEFSNVYYMGKFNLQKIKLGDDIIGLELTLETNAPFGYYDPIEINLSLLSVNDAELLYDTSDEIGFIYPDIVEITCLSAGNLIITNSLDSAKLVINNCINGEILTLNGETKQIYSNKSHARLYNDFNYNFLKIINKNENSMDIRDNVFTTTLPCEIHIVYSPICKVGAL